MSHAFSVPGTPLCGRAEGHWAPAKFALRNLKKMESGYNFCELLHNTG